MKGEQNKKKNERCAFCLIDAGGGDAGIGTSWKKPWGFKQDRQHRVDGTLVQRSMMMVVVVANPCTGGKFCHCFYRVLMLISEVVFFGDFTILFWYSSRWWWFQRFCYFMLFLPPKLGEIIQWRIDHQVVWNDTWTYLEFWVLHCFCLFLAIWHYTTHFFCVYSSEWNWNLQNMIFKKSGGWWFGIRGSTFRLRTRFFFNPRSLAKSAHESRKVQSFFKGNSRGHTVY